MSRIVEFIELLVVRPDRSGDSRLDRLAILDQLASHNECEHTFRIEVTGTLSHALYVAYASSLSLIVSVLYNTYTSTTKELR
jgi:hypothetical protein